MIPNFNKVFKTEPKAEKKVPKGVIEYLNSTVPKGTKYIPGKDGSVILSADGKPVSVMCTIFLIVIQRVVSEKAFV